MPKLFDLDLVIDNFKSFMQQKADVDNMDKCDIVQLKVGLIDEELQELKEAIKSKNINDVRDALVDLRYVLNGAIVAFDLEEVHAGDFHEVHASNQSKLCDTEEIAIATVNAYKNGVHPDKMGISIDCRYVKNDDGKYVVLRTVDDKYMKSIDYVHPVFLPLNT